MIVRSVDGKIIGNLDNGVFSKRVRGRVHMLRSPRAWAIDARAYDTKIVQHANTIEVYDMDTQLTYRCSTELFDLHKGTMDRKFGKQYFLPIHHWDMLTKEQGRLL